MQKKTVSTILVLALLMNGVFAIDIGNNKTIKQNEYKYLIQTLDTDMSQEMKQQKDLINMNFSFGLGMQASDIFALAFNAELLQDTVDRGIALSKLSNQVTKNAMQSAYHDLKIGLISARDQVALAEKELNLSKLKLENLKAKLAIGSVTQTQVTEQSLDVRLKENTLKVKQNTLINMEDTVLNFLNTSDREVLNNIQYIVANVYPMQDVDYYLKGIDNRIELKSLISNTEALQLKVPIYEAYRYDLYRSQKRAFEKEQNQMAINDLQVQASKKQLEQEIKIAYQKVINEEKQLVTLKKTLDAQKTRLDQFKVMKAQGLMTETDVLNFEITVMSIENGYRLANMNYNGLRQKLNYAMSVGPAFK